MKRRRFVKDAGLIAIGGLLIPKILQSCSTELYNDTPISYNGKVGIIGAGAAGLMSAYLLQHYGVKYDVLEASHRIGGRVKSAENFTDFPLDLGAEWIHTDPSILSDLLKKDLSSSIETIEYNPEVSTHINGELSKSGIATRYYQEYKFANSTWHSYFTEYVVPSIKPNIQINTQIKTIDYSNNRVIVTDTSEQTHEYDHLILTVPISILKKGNIHFEPTLPTQKLNALNDVEMPNGLKVFAKFKKRFYVDLILDGRLSENVRSISKGEKAIYDAAWGKNSSDNILALLAVGKPADEYIEQGADEKIVSYFLDELDSIYDGEASEYFEDAIVQNWSSTPFIMGSYSHFENYRKQKHLIKPLDNKVFFAGEAFAEKDTATVHGAAKSAFNAVNALLGI